MRRNRKPRGQKAPSNYCRFTVKDNKALRDAINVMEGFGKYLSEKGQMDLAVELVVVEQGLRDTLRKVRAANQAFEALKLQLDQIEEKTNG